MNYLTTQKSEAPNSGWRKRWFNLNKSLVVVYVIAFVLGLMNLVGTNALATQGVVLDQIESQREKTIKEIQKLSVEIGKISNLSYIESAAANLGFRRVKNSYIITSNDAVALSIR